MQEKMKDFLRTNTASKLPPVSFIWNEGKAVTEPCLLRNGFCCFKGLSFKIVSCQWL